MESELRYVRIDRDFKDMDKLNTLYSNSFPPEERIFSVKEAMEQGNALGAMEGIAVYDGEIMIGFYVSVLRDGYRYLSFLATNPAIRGKGYGGTIVGKILEDNKDSICFGSIEKPVPGTEEFEIRQRRQKFYERNGMITVPYEKVFNGVPFIVVTNRTGEEFDRCYRKEMDLLDAQLFSCSKRTPSVSLIP